MTKSIIAFAERRRQRRALTFFSSLFGTAEGERVDGLGADLQEIRYLSGPKIEVGVTRSQPPALRKKMLAHSRHRATTLVLFRILDAASGIVECLVDLAYVDEIGKGVAFLTDLRLFTLTGTCWFLVPRHEGEVILRVERDDALIPTMRPPWRLGDKQQENEGFELAERLLSDFVWDQ